MIRLKNKGSTNQPVKELIGEITKNAESTGWEITTTALSTSALFSYTFNVRNSTGAGNAAGKGNHVIINHGYGYESIYMHMVRIKAKDGESVKRGQIIGWVGNSGLSSGPHCHYEVHIFGRPVDPVYFFFNDLNAEQYDRLLKLAATGSAKSFD
jgi:murein DD-endopeptidase MepM/ murein hydrolase activator NlpD